MRISKLSWLLLLISLVGCGTKNAVITQPCAHFYEDESDLSIRNSIVAVSAVPSANCPGVQLFVSSGTSLAGAAVIAAQVAGGAAMMAPAPGKDKGIFNTDDWAGSLVKKMDGSQFQIIVPGLSQPIIVVYHAPK